MAAFQIFNLGGSLGEVGFKGGAERTPGRTLSLSYSTAEGDLSILIGRPRSNLFYTRGMTPATVTRVTETGSGLKGRIPELLPVGGTRRTRRNSDVKGRVNGIVKLVN